MTNAKLFSKLRTLLDNATNADKKHIRKLRKVLRKLKERQTALRDGLNEIDSGQERQKIEQEIEVITLQRAKGVEVYRQLKNARKLAKEAKPATPQGAAASDDIPGEEPGAKP